MNDGDWVRFDDCKSSMKSVHEEIERLKKENESLKCCWNCSGNIGTTDRCNFCRRHAYANKDVLAKDYLEQKQ